MQWFVLAAAFTGAVHILADYKGPRWLTYIAKPATLLLIIAMLWSFPVFDSGYRAWLTAALLASLLGDCFLMLPTKPLLPGLTSFLVAHILYVVAFASRAPLEWSFWLLLAALLLVVWLLGMAAFMFDKLGKLVVAGPLYLLALAAMVLFASNVAAQNLANGQLLLAGSLFFLLSDSALAFNRIYQPYRAAQALILSTYYMAQILIAASALTTL